VASLGDPRVRDFLAYGTRTGKLAYLAVGGSPLVAPVWFVVEGDSLVFNWSDCGRSRCSPTSI
jgi:nitroimidazol reductase NimA-like FMN-containing flavoprotein (pyridoxamine 5'-phosphate oxidase superfamily)